ncbi:unnamed protein product [Paramecium sonneborni]|uniref:Uncharacterized protein n=1 Tax=Paramecium sonneborni TaxID=65129 RepID=A0A8S1NQA8_9CILI|nr:unnamed protein product [Paramecium sonneborni]
MQDLSMHMQTCNLRWIEGAYFILIKLILRHLILLVVILKKNVMITQMDLVLINQYHYTIASEGNEGCISIDSCTKDNKGDVEIIIQINFVNKQQYFL